MAEERRRRDEELLILLLLLLAFIATVRRVEAKPRWSALGGSESVTARYDSSASATTPAHSCYEETEIRYADEALAAAPALHYGSESASVSYLGESFTPTPHDGFEQVLIDYHDVVPQLHEGADAVGADYNYYSEACATPSGINPYAYEPSEGWWRFYHFERVEELYDPEWDVFGDIGYIRVQGSILTVRGRSGGIGFVMFNATRHVPSVIATAFRIRDVTGELPRSWLEYYIEDGSQVTVFTLYNGTPNPDGTVTTRILDRNTGQFLTGDITIKQGDWYLFLYDYGNNTIMLIHASGQVIAEAAPSRSATDRTYFYVYFSVSNGNHTLDCDWLGIG